MKWIKFALIGVLFGIVMTKSEVISWYRIQEMFRFQSFHMYGVIGSALAVGIVITQWIKRQQIRNQDGEPIVFKDKALTPWRYLLGGTVFGLGWALSGACPGPMYTLIGAGFPIFVIVLLSAVLGTYAYGVLRDRLPH